MFTCIHKYFIGKISPNDMTVNTELEVYSYFIYDVSMNVFVYMNICIYMDV
jgi:hypothetical protein